MEAEGKTWFMPTSPSTSIPNSTIPILAMPPISPGFTPPNRFPDLSQNSSFPSPIFIGVDSPRRPSEPSQNQPFLTSNFRDHRSTQAVFSPNLPSPPDDHTAPAGFFIPGPRDHQYQPRNLILCFDGPAKYSNYGHTNVIRLFQGLDKMRTDSQLCTYFSPAKSVGQISRPLSKALDVAVAWYLDDHIMGGYRFLAQNYKEGDKICLVGFSRGAYTARCLAGMLHIVGLLPSSNAEQIPFAYSLYKDTSNAGIQKARGFKRAFSRHVSIEFMGLWDCVTSAGLMGKTLPFTSHNAVVKTFRQALALDERRATFRQNSWARGPFDGHPKTEPLQEQDTFSDQVKMFGTAVRNALLLRRRTEGPRQDPSESYAGDQHAKQCPDCNFPWGATNRREVWFAGSHSDVGGGEVDTHKAKHKNNLSNPSLLWMVQQIDASGIGIFWAPYAFDDVPTVKAYFDARRSNLMKSRFLSDTGSRLPLSVIDELQKDVRGKPHDPLRGLTPWRLLEYIPLWKPFLDGDKYQWKELNINRGRGRKISHERPLFHRSVELLMKIEYEPRARRDPGLDPIYVDS